MNALSDINVRDARLPPIRLRRVRILRTDALWSAGCGPYVLPCPAVIHAGDVEPQIAQISAD